jgi:myo-inositol 2-dehydrogenase / D-chiro-inositol 1-dehydrogenase
MSQSHENRSQSSRRNFLKSSAVAGGALAANLGMLSNAVHADGSDEIRIGLIGCGGRGTGAADNALHSAPHVKVYAMGDAFKDRLEGAHRTLSNIVEKDSRVTELGNTVDVPPERRFAGLDAFEKVINSGANYIILATPPGFRPQHLAAAIAAGKNIFTEKPVATDSTGIRRVLEANEVAKSKNLKIGTGLQRHHQAGYLETIKRLNDGAIGDIVAARCYWNQGALWVHPRQPTWSDLEYQIRNWYQFPWLCGDHIVEQHVHNLDVINWVLGEHPIAAVGMGGRQVRTGPEYGEIFDHFAVDYEYPDGIHVLSMCRQIPGCENSVSEAVQGTRGHCQVNAYTYETNTLKGKKTWRRGRHPEDIDPYVQEHTDLIGAIRAGKAYNELKYTAESTLTAIMGRMSTYTGKKVTWDKAMHSKEDLMPQNLAWTMTLSEPPVAVPGKTPLV